MSTGKAPKKNNYTLKNEMDLNFPTQFGKKFEIDNFYSTQPFSVAAFVSLIWYLKVVMMTNNYPCLTAHCVSGDKPM